MCKYSGKNDDIRPVDQADVEYGAAPSLGISFFLLVSSLHAHLVWPRCTMGFKSIAKMVRKGPDDPPSEAELQQQEAKQQAKRQKAHDRDIARSKGSKVLPTNPEQEAHYRELTVRMWQIEKKMQDDRAEVMKPRQLYRVGQSCPC